MLDLAKTSEQYQFLNGRVLALASDITQQHVDAIVNAANSSLLGGGGVDGAIHRAGGPEIIQECRAIRREQFPDGLPTGEAVITTAGRLLASHVIHTVGPIYGSHAGDEAKLLEACYRNSLLLAESHSLVSIAFPAISTGVYGYPKSEAAEIASVAIERFLRSNELLKEVRLVFFQESDLEKFLTHQRFSAPPNKTT